MKKWLLIITSLLLMGCSTVDNATEEAGQAVNETNEVVEQLVEVTINVSVDGEEIEEGQQQVEVEAGTNLLAVMEDHYEIIETDGFISAINGFEQDGESGKYWLFDVNGEMAEVGAADYELVDGDTVDWTLEAFEG